MTSTRLDVIEQVLTCESCELHTVGSGPVPFSGPTPNYLAIVGEAPGRQEDERGEPFVGPAGQLLRSALEGAGIVPAAVTFMNSVSCFPDRTPNRGEVNACATNLAAQLEVCDPRWVLLLGGVALSTLRPDLKISKARGHVLTPPNHRYLVFVTFHPSYALRQAKGEAILREDLMMLTKMMEAEHWEPLTDDSCVVCGLSVEEMGEHDLAIWFDGMGASYCSECYSKASAEGKAETKEIKAVEKVQTNTGKLFA